MASMVPCKKNGAAGYIFYVGLVSQANGNLLQVNPTLAAGDVKIAIDDGAPANLATLPVVDADFTKRVKVVLSQAETNGDNLSIVFSDAAGAEWCDQIINIQTVANQIDDIAAIVGHADYGNAKLVRSTTPANTLDVSATGEAGLDFANIKAASAPTTLTNITVPTVTTVGTLTTYTGNTPQTGDAFARIGALGASLTAIPWNAAWDAEVQSEVHDEILVNNLDHLCLTPTVGTDMTAEVADGTIISRIISNSDTSLYVPLTYNLKNLGDNVAEVHTHVGTIDGHITADYGATEKTCIDLLDDAAGGLADIHTDVGTVTTELAKVPKSDGAVTFNATAAATIQASADAALVANKLDHLVLTADADDVADNSIISKLVSKATTANWSDFVPQTDSLEAIRDRGDLAWLTGAAAAADLSYNPTSVTKVVGGTLAGDHTNLAIVNGSYCSLQETTTTTFLELNVGFSAMSLTAHPAAVRVWAYYSGSASHFIRVQAYNYVSAGYEDVGSIPNGTVVAPYAFSLSPNHIDHVNGVAIIKFLHNASASGVASHYLYLDKVEFDAATPITDYATAAELLKVPKSDSNVTWNATALASIKTQAVAALATDTYAEPGQGAPLATTTLASKINYLYKSWLNQKKQILADGSFELYNNAGDTVDQKATATDAAGVFTFGKIGTGA